MRNILLTLFVISWTCSFAQLPSTLLEPTTRVHIFDNYDGTIYKELKYIKASIIDEESGTFEAKLKYNIYTDALEYKDGSDYFNIIKNPTTHARIGNDYYYYCTFKNQRGLRMPGYYVLVDLNERYRIYKKYSLKIKDPKESVSNGSDAPGRVQLVTNYFLEERGTIMELPLDRKEILASLNSKKAELEKYIKEKKIKLRKEEDLIQLVARYNALISTDANPSRSLLSTAN